MDLSAIEKDFRAAQLAALDKGKFLSDIGSFAHAPRNNAELASFKNHVHQRAAELNSRALEPTAEDLTAYFASLELQMQ